LTAVFACIHSSVDSDSVWKLLSVANIDDSLKKRLDSQGHAFQYAVLRLCQTLRDKKQSPFAFEVAEFPVDLRHTVIHIDFILRASSVYLVAECKRANPALSHWCFARAPYVRRNRSRSRTIVDCISIERTTGRAYADAVIPADGEPYHIAAEIKTTASGEHDSKGRGAIDEAVTQVCRGLNGLIDTMATRTKILPERGVAFLVPVIFTTATLHITDTDLGLADLNDGRLAEVHAQEVPWLWYQHNLSSSLRHSVARNPPLDTTATLGDLLELEHARSIAIVGPRGIEQFLLQVPELLEFARPVTGA
jgi:hypothetical protein